MSEYQYYEFLALDRPLEPAEISTLRSISSRAEISSTRFTNVYNFGDFKGSPEKLMEKYFDAHVYVANWGTQTLMLRLPRGSVDEKVLALYGVADFFKFWTTKEHLIIQWERNDEEPQDEWVDGEGWMARLIAIREELERGDYRALYLGWLYGVHWRFPEGPTDDDDEYEIAGGVRKDTIEPPVPTGLGSLTAAQHALVEFLGLNQDLVTAAAFASSEPSAVRDSEGDMKKWVAKIPTDEARQYLLLLLQGKACQAEQQLRHAYIAFQRSSSPAKKETAEKRRSVAEILQRVGQAREERQAREAKKRQRELEKKRQERERYLATVAKDTERHWKQVEELAGQQRASAYDRARDLLVDLSDAATLTNTRDAFLQRFGRFRTVHGHRPALRQRLEKAKLIS
ncbi:MAG: hypothetical protein AB7G75_30255 [Candidatus Binatia bacterium]